jgi:hypothetical protein
MDAPSAADRARVIELIEPFLIVADQLWPVAEPPCPTWVVPTLLRFSEVVARPGLKSTPQDKRGDDKLIAHLHAVENELWIFGHLAEQGWLDNEEYNAVENLSQGIWPVIEFLEELRDARPHDARIDQRRTICATACASVWRAWKGKVEPHSTKLWKGCDLYWQACGHKPVSCVDSWKDYLLRVSHP